MAQIASDLENKHAGRKLSTMAIRLGFLIEIFLYNYLLKVFIGILIQILIFLSAMLTLSLERLWVIHMIEVDVVDFGSHMIGD